LVAAKQREGRGVGKELYIAQNGKKIAEVSGLERLSSARFVPNRVLPDYGREGKGAAQWVPRVSQRDAGSWSPAVERREGEGARVGHGEREMGRGKRKWGSWASAGFPRGFPFFFFFFFLDSFPKHFPNRIWKAQFISNQKQSTQDKICLSMNAQNHVTKLMINFNFPKII